MKTDSLFDPDFSTSPPHAARGPGTPWRVLEGPMVEMIYSYEAWHGGVGCGTEPDEIAEEDL